MKYIISVFFCCFTLLSCSNLSLVKLTPDIISGYGLDQNTIKNIQCYFQTINIHADSSVTREEPARFIRVDTNRLVTDSSSAAKSTDLLKGAVIVLKNNTPCKIIDVLDSGTVLRAVFDTTNVNPVVANFKLSYSAGYSFELVSDTIFYQNQMFVRFPIPLVKNIGLLYVDKEDLSAREIVLPGRVVQ